MGALETLAAQRGPAEASQPPAVEPVPIIPQARYGFTATYAAQDATCVAARCGRGVPVGVVCFLDERGRTWCHDCGKTERYERRKTAERAAIRAVKED